MEVLSSALILVAAVSVGVSSMYIARGRSSINKHSRQRIKDYENDIKYLGEIKKADAAEYRQEILRLKGTINKMKQYLEDKEKCLVIYIYNRNIDMYQEIKNSHFSVSIDAINRLFLITCLLC